jgi:uncharacterized protein (TIGR02145 family)
MLDLRSIEEGAFMSKFIRRGQTLRLTAIAAAELAAAVAAAIGLAVAGEPSFGTFTDTRDGRTYKTVIIGTQTWMAQNINYQTESGSRCYDNNADNCEQYGSLYDWKTTKTVCPKGWKLPSREDWNRLVAMAGGNGAAGKKLKARSGWNNNGNGTDKFGFSAMPGGYRDYSSGTFDDAGYYGYWWTATEYDASHAYNWDMYYYNDSAYDSNYYKSSGYSVRCVADTP